MPDPWNKSPYFLKFFFQLRFSLKHLTKNRHTRPVPILYYIRSKLLIIWALLKICPLPTKLKAILPVPRKLALPAGTLKQNFWGNEFSISGTKGTHVSVSGTCSRFWKRKDLQIREHLIRIFLDSGTWFPKLKLRFQNQEHLQKSGV